MHIRTFRRNCGDGQ